MTRRVDFGEHVERETAEAAEWYDEHESGLGGAILDTIEAVIDRIAETPLAFPLVHGQTRRALVRRFPYAVYFRLHGEHVVILAVMHSSRDPDQWRSRG